MQHQCARLDVVPLEGFSQELLGVFGIVGRVDCVVHDDPAEDVDDCVGVEESPGARRITQVGDVPCPHLIEETSAMR